MRWNRILKHVNEEKLKRKREVEGDGVSSYLMTKETRRYWNLKKEALDHTPCRNRFGRAVRQNK